MLWLCIRVLSIAVALLACFISPDAERSAYPWKILAPWYSWDAHYYVDIVKNGYVPGRATANFHPLYPWLSSIVALIIREPLLSLLLVASLAGLLLTIAFYWLAKLDCDEAQSRQATALMLLFPASLAIYVPYTESLFLLLSVFCFLAGRQKRFWLAGLAGCLATLTRQQGIFLAVPLAWEAWESSDRDWSRTLKRLLAIALVPAGYGAWILYRALVINEVNPDLRSADKFIYSVMLSPTTYEILDKQQFLPPWVAMWRAIKTLFRVDIYPAAYIDAVLGIVFISMFVLAWRHLRMSYRIYSLIMILVSLSFFTGDYNPYVSLPRHLLLAFPVFIGCAIRFRRPLRLLMVVFAITQLALLCVFVRQWWVL
jgi:Gpi18-like mannosyltransferase